MRFYLKDEDSRCLALTVVLFFLKAHMYLDTTKPSSPQWVYSPSDLTAFMDSPFASWMNRAKSINPDLKQHLDAPDEMLNSLQDQGYAHEAKVLESEFCGKSVTDIGKVDQSGKIAATLAAMQRGDDVVYQGTLALSPFKGYSDFLVKVDGASELGDFHYEVWDSKLAFSPKPYFVVQLCCYSEMLAKIQGVLPKQMGVILGNHEKVIFNTEDYYHYYLALKEKFLTAQNEFDINQMPDPFDSKSYGNWSDYAQSLLSKRDHLSLVANIKRSQIKKLENAGITNCHDLINANTRVPKLNDAVFDRLKAQARLQLASAECFIPKYEVLPHCDEVKGLAMLPPPSPLDVFFDIEGYPMMQGGLEYLWGCTYFDDDHKRVFKDFWAHDSEQEKKSFVEFIQWVYQRWQKDPAMHIYHYASYEITACRKLMGRYGVCEHEVDQLLRNNVFVDLYKVIKGGLMVGVPSYSIKYIEHLYRAKRNTEVANGGDSIVVYERWREEWLAGKATDDWQTNETLRNIRDYNIDDCDSTQELYMWLYARQSENSIEFKGKTSEPEEVPESVSDKITVVNQLLSHSAEMTESDPEAARLLRHFAFSLDFHRREKKPMYWKLFDRLDATPDELEDDADCIGNCSRTKKPPFKEGKARNLSYEYQFSTQQDYKSAKDTYFLLGEINEAGKSLSVSIDRINSDLDKGIITLKSKNPLPEKVHLIPDENINAEPIPTALSNQVERYKDGELRPSAILDFLMRAQPRIRNQNANQPIVTGHGAKRLTQIVRAVENLDSSYLTIQGPPGTGKTFTASRIIGALLKNGKRVGISSNSHKAINNLLFGVVEYCKKEKIKANFFCSKNTDEKLIEDLGIQVIKTSEITTLLSDASVVGTTAWGFSREDVADEFDYLFIDEAGQVSVANLIAMSQSAKNLVLMGDQMQLGQPSQGTHPEQSGLSILDYLLGDTPAIDPTMGVFLDTTYRMHSAVNQFISDAVYNGELESAEETDKQKIELANPNLFPRSEGIVFYPVPHEGNTFESAEEVVQIRALVGELCKSTFIDRHGNQHKITLADILFVAPYNAQVELIKREFGEGAKVGSVDKFQGQEAPIVIYSLCTSDAAESPRGIDFLYNKNRLNVAISRAQALAIVVGSPTLLCPEVNTIEQMRQVSVLSRLKDFAVNRLET